MQNQFKSNKLSINISDKMQAIRFHYSNCDPVKNCEKFWRIALNCSTISYFMKIHVQGPKNWIDWRLGTWGKLLIKCLYGNIVCAQMLSYLFRTYIQQMYMIVHNISQTEPKFCRIIFDWEFCMNRVIIVSNI